MGDGELIERAQLGDRDALERLLRSHYSSWYQICRRVMGNDADAADATQEGLIAVVKGLDRFDGRSKFSTWSYRVVINRCYDELRRRNRAPLPHGSPAAVDAAPAGSANRTPSDSVDPGVQVITSIDLDEKLRQLSDDFRTILVLRDLVGFDYADIADMLEIPIGTVRSRLARARSSLAQLYANDDADVAPNGASAHPTHNSAADGNFPTGASVKPSDL